MSTRLFSAVCPVMRTAPSRKRARRRAITTWLLLLAVAPPLVALAWHCAARAAGLKPSPLTTHEEARN
jgi:peptidoglycan/LPS O-acetylase OafA/YrhL